MIDELFEPVDDEKLDHESNISQINDDLLRLQSFEIDQGKAKHYLWVHLLNKEDTGMVGLCKGHKLVAGMKYSMLGSDYEVVDLYTGMKSHRTRSNIMLEILVSYCKNLPTASKVTVSSHEPRTDRILRKMGFENSTHTKINNFARIWDVLYNFSTETQVYTMDISPSSQQEARPGQPAGQYRRHD